MPCYIFYNLMFCYSVKTVNSFFSSVWLMEIELTNAYVSVDVSSMCVYGKLQVSS